MDRRAWIVCTLLALGAAGALLFGTGNSAPPQDLVEVSAKRAHLAFVLEELSGRDVSHLTSASRRTEPIIRSTSRWRSRRIRVSA